MSETPGDLDLVCIDCGDAFDFPASEQHYFAERGLQQPKRCRGCRIEARERRERRESASQWN